jgi:predicted ATPase/tetratricopeptide (TPR) repeat protein/DNA-binding XRE family transcriptional regulator
MRTNAGLSQDGLAERAGISAKTVGALEQGTRRAPHDDTLRRLVAALSLSTEARASLVDAATHSRAHRRLETDNSAKNNLPSQLTSFIDRDDIEKIAALLGTYRLVTITGAGGIGKTRTAIELARQRFVDHDNVCFLDLSSIQDGTLIVPELAGALELETHDELSQLEQIERELQAPTLLLLDNCEHLLPKLTQIIPTLLARCASLKILATSREPLSLSFEASYRLPSLGVPKRLVETLAEAHSFSALRLFLERAQSDGAEWIVTPSSLGAIGKICMELDGIPLAIELAASRVSTLGLEMLLRKLRAGVTLSGKRDYPQRHQTMTATIAWSYDLLDNTERTLFRRLSVFDGTFSIDAAERVCVDGDLPVVAILDTFHRLTQKSLVTIVYPIIHGQQILRYRLLGAIRSFADAQMSTQERLGVRSRYVVWLCDLANTAHENPAGLSAISIVAEFDNARSAVAACIAEGSEKNLVDAATIVGGLRRAWDGAARFSELRTYVEFLLDALSEEKYPELTSRLLVAAIIYSMRDRLSVIERAVPLLISVGNTRAAAALLSRAGELYSRQGAFEEAHRSFAEALELLAGTDLSRNRPYWQLLYLRAWVFTAQGRVAEALDDLAAVRPLLDDVSDPDFIERTCVQLVEADIEIVRGQPAKALRIFEALILAQRSDNRLAAGIRSSMAICQLALANYDQAAIELGRSFMVFRDYDREIMDPLSSRLLIAAAAVLTHQSRPRVAAIVLGFFQHNLQKDRAILALERPAYDSLWKALRQQLTPPELEESLAEGGDMEFDGVIDLIFSSGLFRLPD